MKTSLSDEILNARFGQFAQGFEHRAANAQGGDETVDVLKNPDGTWSIQSPNGEHWLSVQPDGTREARPVSDPGQPGPWEKFSRHGNVLTEMPKDGLARPLVQFILRETEADAPVPPPPATSLTALHVDGPLLRQADNAIYSLKWVTGFDAPRRVHLKEFDHLRLFTAWARSVGANGLRMFGGWNRTSFDFRNIPDYFTRVLPDLNLFLQDEGMGGEFVCICDGKPNDPQEQTDFINRCMGVLGDFLLVGEANEPWKNNYDPQLHTFNWPGRLMTKGAPEAGTWPWPYVPTRGVTVHHSPRDEQWARKCGKDAYEIRGTTQDAVFDEEPPGFAEVLKPWSRVNNPRHAFVAGVGARMFSPGMVAHGDTDTMQMCNVPGPIETECTRRCFEGIDFVPAEAPTWLYARYGPSNPGVPMPVEDDIYPAPGRLTDHMHAMIGPGRAVVCNYYPSNGWVAKGANGWHVVKQDDGAVLCER